MLEACAGFGEGFPCVIDATKVFQRVAARHEAKCGLAGVVACLPDFDDEFGEFERAVGVDPPVAVGFLFEPFDDGAGYVVGQRYGDSLAIGVWFEQLGDDPLCVHWFLSQVNAPDGVLSNVAIGAQSRSV